MANRSTPPTHLIIVCCHGIWLGGPEAGHDEAEWLIADFQRGETDTFVEHARAGVRCLAERESDAVLVFSGGPTRRETALSEAQSYANLAAAHNHWDLIPAPLTDSILVEDRALDSYHNILFSLSLFFTRFGAWPRHLTIVSHAFKRPRLIDSHCAAIGFPAARVTFVGIDPPAMARGEKPGAMDGVSRAVGEWAADPHGRGEGLRGKREARNPWGRWQGVFEEEKEGDVRERSGLVTRGEGAEEVLVEEAIRPWL